MAEGAVFESSNSVSILANSLASLKGNTSGPAGVAGSARLVAGAVAESEDLVKVERSSRKITLCPTTRRISVTSCFVMLANMASEVTAFSARMSMRAAGMSCIERNVSSQGELSPA